MSGTLFGSLLDTKEIKALKHSTHCKMVLILRFFLRASVLSADPPLTGELVVPRVSGRNSHMSMYSPLRDFFTIFSETVTAFWPTVTVTSPGTPS